MLPLILALSSPAALAEEAPEATFETWNLGLAHGFVDYAEERTPALLDAVGAADADVLCLQEVWDAKDRKQVGKAVGEQWTWQKATDVEKHRASKRSICDMGDLFGEGRFVSCLSDQCGGLEGDEEVNCIIDKCQAPLDALKESKPECAKALLAQVGKPAPVALLNIVSPFKKAQVFAYNGSDGLLLYSKLPVSDSGMVDFTDISTLNRRRALWADVKMDGEPVRVYCTHLTADLSKIAPYPGDFDAWGPENMAQVERLIAHADESDRPVVMLGDFNCGFGGEGELSEYAPELPESCQAFLDAGYADPASHLEPACTWCETNKLNEDGGEHGNAIIDHVFTRGFTPLTGDVVHDEVVEIAVGKETVQTSLSDHYGYAATVRLGEPEPEPEPEPVEEAEAPEDEAGAEGGDSPDSDDALEGREAAD